MLFDVKFLLKLFCSNSTSKEMVKVFIFFITHLYTIYQKVFLLEEDMSAEFFFETLELLKICYKGLLQSLKKML